MSASTPMTLPSSPSLPLPPTVPRTREAVVAAPQCHQQAVQTTAVSTSTDVLPSCSSPPGAISCVHHIHHIHHVHHVHHHLHHMPPPPPPSLPPAPLPSPGGSQPVPQPVTSSPPPVVDDVSALVMMLENAASLGETPPPPPPLKDSKPTEQSVVVSLPLTSKLGFQCFSINLIAVLF